MTANDFQPVFVGGLDHPLWVVDTVTGQIASTQESISYLVNTLNMSDVEFLARVRLFSKFNPRAEVYILELT